MPSLCAIESCKLVKQIGEETSFHKFPFHNPDVLKLWISFVEKSTPVKTQDQKQKKITKYSSICSRHFELSDFSVSHSQSRKFLKKGAVPSKSNSIAHREDDEPREVEMVDPLSNAWCCLCRKRSHLRNIDDCDLIVSLIRKCLGSLDNLSLHINFQKLCSDCLKILNEFSLFVDKVSSNASEIGNLEVHLKRNIKVEPIASFGDESIYNIQPSHNDEQFSTMQMSSQKKCEILEIVDIKPINFDSGPHQEHYIDDEGDIQILSPKELKVELTDHDDEGSNELELIKRYIFISTVFLQDHNYVKTSSIKQGVKTESEPGLNEEESARNSVPLKTCNMCKKSFKTFKKYLIHKIADHQTKTSLGSQKKKKSKQNHTFKRFRSQIIKFKREEEQTAVKREKRKLKSFSGYSCEACSKEFQSSRSLYQHKVSHSSSFFSCDLCDKRFKRPHGLSQHVKSIHEKERKHTCNICGHKYFFLADMVKCRHSKLKKLL